jgi:hypothetical protein
MNLTLLLALALAHSIYTQGECPTGYVVKGVPRTGKPTCVADAGGGVVGPHTHALGTDTTGRLPLNELTDDDTTANRCLLSGGAGGEPAYGACPVTPAGVDTQVQFNDGGFFAGSALFTFNKTTGILTANRYVATEGYFLAGTGTPAVLRGAAVDGGSAIGVWIDQTPAFANANAKIVSFRNGGVEKGYVRQDGQLYAAGGVVSNGFVYGTGFVNNGASPAQLVGTIADGPAAIATVLRSNSVYADAGSKLVSIQNGNGNEKVSVNKDGVITAGGLIGNASTATALAADPVDCAGAGEFAKGVTAAGVASGCAVPAMADATDLITGGIRLTGDLGGSATAPTVVDNSHAHTGATVSALDAADTTTGTFDHARIPAASDSGFGGLKVPALDCKGAPNKITFDQSTKTLTCETDETGASTGPTVYVLASNAGNSNNTVWTAIWSVILSASEVAEIDATIWAGSAATTTGHRYQVAVTAGSVLSQRCSADIYTADATLTMYNGQGPGTFQALPTAGPSVIRPDRVRCAIAAGGGGATITLSQQPEVNTSAVTAYAGSRLILSK